jgi:hypothetical protein
LDWDYDFHTYPIGNFSDCQHHRRALISFDSQNHALKNLSPFFSALDYLSENFNHITGPKNGHF